MALLDVKKVAAWDFGGTLNQGTWGALTEGFNDFLKDHNLLARPDRRVVESDLRQAGSSCALWIERLAPEVSVTRETVDELSDAINARTEEFVRPLDYARDVLQTARRKGYMNLACSMSEDSTVLAVAQAAGIADLFDAGLPGLPGITVMGAARRLGDPYASDGKRTHEYKGTAIKEFAKGRPVVMTGDAESDIRAGVYAGAERTFLIYAGETAPKTVATRAFRSLREVAEAL